jgi:hypothetical protein
VKRRYHYYSFATGRLWRKADLGLGIDFSYVHNRHQSNVTLLSSLAALDFQLVAAFQVENFAGFV